MKRKLLIISGLLLLMVNARSQDRVFTRTYQSNVLTQGSLDIEYWGTWRNGHKNSFANYIDQRLELEIGLGHNLQTAFYLNTTSFALGDPLHLTDGITSGNEIFFSNEWKWKLSDPVANPIGSALYAELGLKADEVELETKIILDKRINNELIALNLVSELEWETTAIKGTASTKLSTPFEVDFAYMHFFNPHLGIGLELTDFNAVEDKWTYSALFGGPSLHVSGEHWFINFNFLPQLMNLHKTTDSPDNLELYKEEKLSGRIVFGYSL